MSFSPALRVTEDSCPSSTPFSIQNILGKNFDGGVWTAILSGHHGIHQHQQQQQQSNSRQCHDDTLRLNNNNSGRNTPQVHQRLNYHHPQHHILNCDSPDLDLDSSSNHSPASTHNNVHPDHHHHRNNNGMQIEWDSEALDMSINHQLKGKMTVKAINYIILYEKWVFKLH